MSASMILWLAFFKELQRQNPQNLDRWLGCWVFSDNGAALLRERENPESTPISLEEKQKKAALFIMTKGKWPKTVH